VVTTNKQGIAWWERRRVGKRQKKNQKNAKIKIK